MPKNKIFYHAFRIKYPHIVKEIVTDIHIGLSSILPNGGTKSFIKTRAIWDTGATCTVITNSIVQKLKLIPTGKSPVHGVNSTSVVNSYIVDIGLPNKVLIQNCNIIESNLNSPGIEVLIGMDIIQAGDFAIANANGKTFFSYCIPPHKNPIDLYEKSMCINPKIKR